MQIVKQDLNIDIKAIIVDKYKLIDDISIMMV